MPPLESDFQRSLLSKIRAALPGCYILKNDPTYLQGVPDITILYGDRWAVLEVKRSAKARKRPNQDYRVNEMNDMSFAAIVHPENEEEVLNGLYRALQAPRNSRLPKR